jgi:beta-lactam-binding protein with PASTA domain/predicted Ser/Thr protein kinase
MATVYCAWDRNLERPCAVKVLADHLSRDEEGRRRFRREAEAVRALVHPHIVAVYGYGDADSIQYITMEYVEGGTLGDLVRRCGRLPEAAALRIAAEVADALAYAHSRHVVHRDIKPHNILLTGDGHVKVADFGIARTLDAPFFTRTGSVLGSTQYISPEQARGDQAGPAADQYSLGVVLYEALAGRLPFEGEASVAIALKHLNEPPFDLQWIRPDLSTATAALVRRLLAKSPQDRYPTAAELAKDLRRLSAEVQSCGIDEMGLPIPELAGSRDPTHCLVRSTAAGHVPVDEREVMIPVRTAVAPGADVSDHRAIQGQASRPRRRLRAPAVLKVLAIVSLAVLGTAMYRWSTLRAHVPSLLGQTVAVAQQAVAPLQLGVTVTSHRQDPRAAVGVVLSQDPPPGRDVLRGSVIQLAVSEGTGTVPDLRGEQLSQAEQRLRRAGLRIGRVSYGDDDKIASGAVLSQSLASGVHAPPNGPVDVVVSHGPHQPPLSTSAAQAGAGTQRSGIVPDLHGIPVSQAEQQLQAAGLQLGRVNYTYDDRAAAGTVIHQWSGPGTRLAPMASVDVLVSRGSPPPATPEPAPTSQPATPSPQPTAPSDTGN